MPLSRTYHAACLVSNFMVVIGGEHNSDMQDIWALDVEEHRWHNLVIDNRDTFKAKRFHSANTISGSRIVTFGGCHSEYVHMNDVNIFDLSDFVNSEGQNHEIICIKLEFQSGDGLPTTRWGHAASVYDDKLYILGGRNECDISDLHCFDIEAN